jgi:hypothetical protein
MRSILQLLVGVRELVVFFPRDFVAFIHQSVACMSKVLPFPLDLLSMSEHEMLFFFFFLRRMFFCNMLF